jgi:hypothetical protein
MPTEHSFSPEFYLAEGEPYDRPALALNTAGKPVSLFSAICLALESEDFRQSVVDVLEVQPNSFSTAEVLFDLAVETSLCDGYASPVKVWIDSEGELTVEVYE